MKLGSKSASLAAALLLATVSSARATVLDEKSPAQKLRADIATQLATYAKCLSAVVLDCEKKGFLPGEECILETGTANPPADPKNTFAAQIAKCDAKLDFDRKGPTGNTPVQNYELIGCPSYGAGTRLADMDAFEAGASLLKKEIDGFVHSTPLASGCTDTRACRTDMKIILDLRSGLAKCETACENDYKNKKGDGGPDDDAQRCGTNGDKRAQICAQKALEKFIAKADTWPLGVQAALAVITLVDKLNDDLFDAPNACP